MGKYQRLQLNTFYSKLINILHTTHNVLLKIKQCVSFSNHVFRAPASSSFDNLGPLNWPLVLCLALAWSVICYGLLRGITSSGKVSKPSNMQDLFERYFVNLTMYFSWPTLPPSFPISSSQQWSSEVVLYQAPWKESSSIYNRKYPNSPILPFVNIL